MPDRLAFEMVMLLVTVSLVKSERVKPTPLRTQYR